MFITVPRSLKTDSFVDGFGHDGAKSRTAQPCPIIFQLGVQETALRVNFPGTPKSINRCPRTIAEQESDGNA